MGSPTHDTNLFLLQTEPVAEARPPLEHLVAALRRSASYCALGERFAAPFESFYISARNSLPKTRVLPVFHPQVEEGLQPLWVEGPGAGTLLALRVELFVAAFGSLAEQLRAGGPPLGGDCLLCPLFNFEQQFFSFAGLARFADYDATPFSAYAKPALRCDDVFVRVRSFSTGEELVFPASELLAFTRCDDCDFLLERLYLCSKVMHAFNAGLEAREAGLRLARAAPPVLSVGRWRRLAEQLGAAGAPVRPRLPEFAFFCAQADVGSATALLQRLVELVEQLAGEPAAPRCFYVEAKAGEQPCESLRASLLNKVGDGVSLAFVLGSSAFSAEDFRHAKDALQLPHCKVLFLDGEAALSGLQQKLWRFLHSRAVPSALSLDEPLPACLFVRRGRRGGFKLLVLDFGDAQTSPRAERARCNEEELAARVEALVADRATALLVPPELASLRVPAATTMVCLRSALQLFLNVRKALGFDDMRVNFQTFRRYIALERFFANRQLEELYDLCVLPVVGTAGLLALSASGSWALRAEEGADEQFLAGLARALMAVHVLYFPLREFLGRGEG